MRKVRATVGLLVAAAALVASAVIAPAADATGRCELRFYDGRPSIVC